jgi:ketosteroid isomerase-like protein
MTDIRTLVDAFADMILTGTLDKVDAHLTPGAVVWHNSDRKDVDARENMVSVAMLGQLVSDVSFEERYCSRTAEGFVLQFAIHGTVRSGGSPFAMENCVVVTTDGGKMARIEEYVDPTVGAQLTGGS